MLEAETWSGGDMGEIWGRYGEIEARTTMPPNPSPNSYAPEPLTPWAGISSSGISSVHRPTVALLPGVVGRSRSPSDVIRRPAEGDRPLATDRGREGEG